MDSDPGLFGASSASGSSSAFVPRTECSAPSPSSPWGGAWFLDRFVAEEVQIIVPAAPVEVELNRSLLQVIAGLRAPDRGSVVLSPRNATVGYLPQEPDRREGETVLDFIARRTGSAAAQLALDEATAALERGDDGAERPAA